MSVCMCVCARVPVCACMCGCVRLHTTSNTFLVTTDTPSGIASTLQEYQSWTPEMQNTDYSMIPISYVVPLFPIG